ncbi:MAG: helical backbone metal receptor [Candidatus Wenzhouxiangella sp. M2_3B_020]
MNQRAEVPVLFVAVAVAMMVTALVVALPARGDRTAVRIVSLAPHLTELAFEAGLGDRLVGAVAWSDFPAAARQLPRIGDAFRFDLEKIVRLDATHALAWQRGTPRRAIEELEALGIEVVSISTGSLDEIPQAVVRLGRLGGAPEAARETAAAFRARRAELQRRYGETAAIPVFYQVSRTPLFTLGADHVINDVFALCGAENVFDDLEVAAATVDLESVLERDPLAIIAGRADETERPGAHWEEFEHLRAVRCDHLLDVDPAVLVRPTPRLLDGAAMLCEWLDERVRQAEDPACRSGRG